MFVEQLRRVSRPALDVSVDRHDKMRWVTVAGAVGFVAALLMALFGLPPVDLHSPLNRMGIMDPLCGATRAARLTAQGNLSAAWTYNPLGIAAVIAATAAVARVGLGLAARRWINITFVPSSSRTRVAVAVVLALLVALEIRQQGRADLLLRPY